MTAEIALLNKHAVALAADSAVTISGAEGNKIYNAANKLFALSKYEPIGVMVYGNAEYMGVPWETIIKIFRHELNEKSFDKVEEYYASFLDFLAGNNDLFGSETQETYVFSTAFATYARVRDRIRGKIDALTKAEDHIDESAISKIRSAELGVPSDLLRAGYALNMDVEHEAEVRERYQVLFDRAMDAVFERLPLSEEDRANLRERVVLALTRAVFPSGTSGVVVAGFGRKEHFPALYSATVEGRIADRLKYANSVTSVISNQVGAEVVPFAQADGVQLFIEGIEPSHRNFAAKLALETLQSLRTNLLECLALSEDVIAAKSEKCEQLVDEHWRAFNEKARDTRQSRYVDPLISVIETLPKDELAAAAEALVNLTSLRRKMSMDAETVGGPIDVAVISKGDGLIWVQRKHYFRAELNRAFFENYYRQPAKEA
jgi:hypothetical protein